MNWFSYIIDRLSSIGIGATKQLPPPTLSEQKLDPIIHRETIERRRKLVFRATVEQDIDNSRQPSANNKQSSYECIPNSQFSDTELMQQSERVVASIIKQLQHNSH